MTVLSKDPKSTRLTYRVQAVHRANFPAWHRAMHHAKLYINGGGSLIQDVTSRRSLWYYLHNIQTAKRCGCKVQMYGCGIGPVIRESHRKMAARVLNANVDAITLGDRILWRSCGLWVWTSGDPADGGPRADAAPGPGGPDRQCAAAGRHPSPRPIYLLRPAALERLRGKSTALQQGGGIRLPDLWPHAGVCRGGKAPGPRRQPDGSRGLSVPHYFLNDAGSAGTIIGASAGWKSWFPCAFTH